jgi:Fe-S-cluster-containing hydrogenase component 2
MGAIAILDNTAMLSPEKCIGCGLCVSVCPGEAISLTRREDPPEVPATTRDLGVKVLSEKGRLEDFLKQMKP